MTSKETQLFRELNSNSLSNPYEMVLDPAHVLEVSQYPALCYCAENIVILNRLVHSRLDHCQDPITGKHIDFKERNKWWIRILGKSQLSQLFRHEQARLYFYDFIN